MEVKMRDADLLILSLHFHALYCEHFAELSWFLDFEDFIPYKIAFNQSLLFSSGAPETLVPSHTAGKHDG